MMPTIDARGNLHDVAGRFAARPRSAPAAEITVDSRLADRILDFVEEWERHDGDVDQVLARHRDRLGGLDPYELIDAYADWDGDLDAFAAEQAATARIRKAGRR